MSHSRIKRGLDETPRFDLYQHIPSEFLGRGLSQIGTFLEPSSLTHVRNRIKATQMRESQAQRRRFEGSLAPDRTGTVQVRTLGPSDLDSMPLAPALSSSLHLTSRKLRRPYSAPIKSDARPRGANPNPALALMPVTKEGWSGERARSGQEAGPSSIPATTVRSPAAQLTSNIRAALTPAVLSTAPPPPPQRPQAPDPKVQPGSPPARPSTATGARASHRPSTSSALPSSARPATAGAPRSSGADANAPSPSPAGYPGFGGARGGPSAPPGDERVNRSDNYLLSIIVSYEGDLSPWRFDVVVTDLGRVNLATGSLAELPAFSPVTVAERTVADSQGRLFVPAPPLHDLPVPEASLIEGQTPAPASVSTAEAPPFDPVRGLAGWVQRPRDLLGRSIRVEVMSVLPYSSKVLDFAVVFTEHGPKTSALVEEPALFAGSPQAPSAASPSNTSPSSPSRRAADPHALSSVQHLWDRHWAALNIHDHADHRHPSASSPRGGHGHALSMPRAGRPRSPPPRVAAPTSRSPLPQPYPRTFEMAGLALAGSSMALAAAPPDRAHTLKSFGFPQGKGKDGRGRPGSAQQRPNTAGTDRWAPAVPPAAALPGQAPARPSTAATSVPSAPLPSAAPAGPPAPQREDKRPSSPGPGASGAPPTGPVPSLTQARPFIPAGSPLALRTVSARRSGSVTGEPGTGALAAAASAQPGPPSSAFGAFGSGSHTAGDAASVLATLSAAAGGAVAANLANTSALSISGWGGDNADI